jgi:uncharacterized protein YjbI with pentapeptide repeats
MSEELGKTCEYEPFIFKACNRLLYDDEHCVFHSKDIEGKKDKFRGAFWEEFEKQKKEGEVYDFRGFVFPEEIRFEYKVFDKKADFTKAQFSGLANFNYAKFSEIVSFQKAQFSEIVAFGETKFPEIVSFAEAQFSKDRSNTFFSDAEFPGEADFSNAQFFGEADFNNAEFTGKSYFREIKFNDFNKCNMTDTSFYNVSGLLEYLAENRKKIKHPRGIKYLHEKCKPILGEPTVSRLPLLSREIKDDIYLMSFKGKHPRLHFIWWLFADCGRSFLRWALWSVLFAVLFAFIFHNIFYLNDLESFNRANIHDTWPGFSLIYYSVVTFTTLGFGDITPKPGWLQFWVMAEVILGYVMLGGLISILANKLARRS